MERWFGPSEMAKRLGVSGKALRVYEEAGLVRAHRTETGWRTYGPQAQARLHQVLVLKRLGLSLKRIGELLAGEMGSLDAVLALQQQVLEARRDETERALSLLAAAREKLKRDGALSPDDLTQLTRETAMTQKMTDNEWEQTMKPHINKHFTPDEQAAWKARMGDFDQAEITRQWDELIAEGRKLQAIGDTTSTAAMDHAVRWMAQVKKFSGDNPAMATKAANVNLDALADASTAPKMPFDLSLMQFVGAAYRNAQAK